MSSDKEHTESLPFPDSLCHRCAAPPKYVRGATSVFILCPLLPNKYPPQPVLACDLFKPRPCSPPETVPRE
jgi:hypothetical protein